MFYSVPHCLYRYGTSAVNFSRRPVQEFFYVKLSTDRQTNAGHYITRLAEVPQYRFTRRDFAVAAVRTTLYRELVARLRVIELVVMSYRLATELTLDKSFAALKVHVGLQLTAEDCRLAAVWTVTCSSRV